jgi:hypothetical protein
LDAHKNDMVRGRLSLPSPTEADYDGTCTPDDVADTNKVIGNKKDEEGMYKGLGHHGTNWVG